jgi:hypothetical protein
VIASQTLYPGEAITVNGETLGLATSGSVVILKSGASTTTEGLGDYIWQGIATSASASTTGSASESSRKVAQPRRVVQLVLPQRADHRELEPRLLAKVRLLRLLQVGRVIRR